MLAYETVVALLLSGAEQSNLTIQFSHENLDPHTMTRQFTMTCVPQKSKPGRPTPTATLNFVWNVAQSALSVLGNEVLCDMYHEPDEPCPHAKAGCAYETFLDINVEYELPLSASESRDIPGVPLLAKAIQDITAELTYDEEPLEVDVQIRFTAHGQALIHKVSAQQQWVLGDEVHNEQELLETFTDISDEISMLLDVLFHLNSPDQLSPTDIEPDDAIFEDHGYDLRTYLRPPTA